MATYKDSADDRGSRSEHITPEQARMGTETRSGYKTHDLAWWLDRSIPLPGGFRIGLDGLIGLIPGVGDAIGGGLSSWIIYQGYRRGVPKLIMVRMIINVLLDATLGSIPILGDLFDFVFKANSRNMKLINDYEMSPRKTYKRSAISTVLFVTALVVVAALVFYGVIALTALIWKSVHGA